MLKNMFRDLTRLLPWPLSRCLRLDLRRRHGTEKAISTNKRMGSGDIKTQILRSQVHAHPLVDARRQPGVLPLSLLHQRSSATALRSKPASSGRP